VIILLISSARSKGPMKFVIKVPATSSIEYWPSIKDLGVFYLHVQRLANRRSSATVVGV